MQLCTELNFHKMVLFDLNLTKLFNLIVYFIYKKSYFTALLEQLWHYGGKKKKKKNNCGISGI